MIKLYKIKSYRFSFICKFNKYKKKKKYKKRKNIKKIKKITKYIFIFSIIYY